MLYYYCTVAKTASKVGDAIAAVRQMEGAEYWSVKARENLCDEAEEMMG